MTAQSEDTRPSLRELYEAKATAEIAQAERLLPGADIVSSFGNPLARTMLVKGQKGPAEEGGGAALSGEDGAAARKALEALGLDPQDVFAVVSRPTTDPDPDSVAQRVRGLIEAVDPVIVIALDDQAAADLAAAFALDSLAFGTPVTVFGRTLLAVDGLEASLGDESRKRKVWKQFRTIASGKPSAS